MQEGLRGGERLHPQRLLGQAAAHCELIYYCTEATVFLHTAQYINRQGSLPLVLMFDLGYGAAAAAAAAAASTASAADGGGLASAAAGGGGGGVSDCFDDHDGYPPPGGLAALVQRLQQV